MFKIKDNTLITQSNYNINSIGTTIDVVGEIPIASNVMCHITGPFNEYSFALNYKETTDEGNTFSSPFIIDDNSLKIQKLNSESACYFYITINGVIIDNKQLITISPKLISTADRQIVYLIKEVNTLKQELKTQIASFKTTEANIKKGMVPVATGVGDGFVWDYLFDNVTKNVEDLAKLMTKTSEALDALTKRVNDIEEKLHNHMYENYYI